MVQKCGGLECVYPQGFFFSLLAFGVDQVGLYLNTWTHGGFQKVTPPPPQERQLRASYKKADMGQNHQNYSPKETLEDFALKLQVTHQTLTSSRVEIL